MNGGQVNWKQAKSMLGGGLASPAPQFKSINSSAVSLLYDPTLTSYMTTGKTTVFTIWTFVGKVIPLLFNMLSSFVIAFLPRRKLSEVK